MKKVSIVAIFVLVAAALVGVVLNWRTLIGAYTAIKAPTEDVTEYIPSGSSTSTTSTVNNSPFTLPKGFVVSLFAKNLKAPRVMVFDPSGTLVTSITSEGKVVALPDKNGDGVADETIVVASGLTKPHGLAFRTENGKTVLDIAETTKVTEWNYDVTSYHASNPKKLFNLPSGGRHFTRTLLQAPSGELLVSIGSTCDVCHEKDPRNATIMAWNGKELVPYAKGLRNSVFMTLHPVTGEVWATEMGRDLLGDDVPPDEINIIKKDGNYGWPNCYGKNIHDTAFDHNTYIRNPCMEPFELPPAIEIPAHSAPLGLVFIPEEGWPESYWYNLLIAYHGSWNRSTPTGYKIVRYKLDAKGKYLGEEDFMTGFLGAGGKKFGRPADIVVQPGGVIYVSDDSAGVIYRITYHP